jgi:TldD protein
MPRQLVATPTDRAPHVGDPALRELAMRALDAARGAGASYADVRFTLTRQQAFYYGNAPIDTEHIAVGVRALANGAWGFVAGPRWTPDDVAGLGAAAAAQAKANAWDGVPPVEIGPPPPPATGTWAHPVKRDPFTVPIDEKMDAIRAAEAYAGSFRNGGASSIIIFERQERTFASTDGAFATQTLYNSLGNGSSFLVSASDPVTRRSASRQVPFVSPTAAGYELFDELRIIDAIPQLYEEARQKLSAQPIASMRYEIVFDGYAMASFVNESIAAALELDRALGLEANASGTSYLAPVESTLGTSLSASRLTVTAERSDPVGAGTVKWDDDGVTPEPFTLVRDGIITSYASNREFAPVLAQAARQNGPARSHGCAASGTAMDIPLIHVPNIRMHPSASGGSFDDLVAGVQDGLAIHGGGCSMDHQKLTGQGGGELVYRIKKGKIVGVVSGATYLFRSRELWKNMTGVGNETTMASRGMQAWKGQPRQETVHTVTAPAARIANMVIINAREGR